MSEDDSFFKNHGTLGGVFGAAILRAQTATPRS
jgi:hypothetical protein